MGMPSSSAFLSLAAPGLGAQDDGPGPRRHAPRRLASPGQDGLLGLLPGVARDASRSPRPTGPRASGGASVARHPAGTADRRHCARGTAGTADTGTVPARAAPAAPDVTRAPGSTSATPATRSLSMTRRLAVDATNSTTLSAMTGPIPSTAASSANSAHRSSRRATRRRAPGPGSRWARDGGSRARRGAGSGAGPSRPRWRPGGCRPTGHRTARAATSGSAPRR